jgi:DNA-binding response OmpR family regulator
MNKHVPTILIIEDEKSLLKAWVRKFEREGFRVLTAGDGSEAVDTALKNHPDMIVVDLVMPSSDGLYVIKKLREDKWGTQVPVMFLNSWRDPQNFSQAATSPTEEHVGSSWNLEQIVNKVEKKLEVMKLGLA